VEYLSSGDLQSVRVFVSGPPFALFWRRLRLLLCLACLWDTHPKTAIALLAISPFRRSLDGRL
jgi:hypothetical protein